MKQTDSLVVVELPLSVSLNYTQGKHYINKIYVLLFCPSWSYTIICCIHRFTSLCKNLFNLLEFVAETLRCHVYNFQCLTVPAPSSIENDAHSIHRYASAKNSNKLNKFLHREVNLLIQRFRFKNCVTQVA